MRGPRACQGLAGDPVWGVARQLLILLLALVVTTALSAAATGARAQTEPGRRVALVIGNATYTNGGVLDNPENDADAVAAKLTSLGFQVTLDKNLGQSGMRNLFGAFMSKVRDGDLVLVYYAGHGIEADGRDYMLPVDVSLETPNAVQFQGIPLDMAYPDKATFGVIIIFDACRDNPFLRRVKGQVAGTHALSPPVGSLVLFSASAGDVAEDGATDGAGAARKNSVFTTALINALSIPDASIQRIYQSTLREVRTQTANRQAPTRFGDLADDFVFNRGASQMAAAPPITLPSPAAAPAAPEAPAPTVLASASPPGGPVHRSAPVPPQAAAPAQPSIAAPDPAPASHPGAPPPVAMVAPSPAPAPPPAARPAPAVAGSFTMASLGQNILPPPPQLEPVPPVIIPQAFCTVQEEIAFLNTVFRPAYDVAFRNNELAIAYLSGLNRLGAEYNSVQSGFVFQIKAQFDAFAPIAAKANQTSNDTLALDSRIRAVPVGTCPKK